LILGGSPGAVVALTLFDVGALDQLQAFAMITGSRLGASLIILLIGFLYLMRGGGRITSLSTGLLSLVVTGFVHLVALPLGWFLLTCRILDSVEVSSPFPLLSAIDALFHPLVGLAGAHLSGAAVFIGGIGIILGSFKLFDKSLPDFRLERWGFGQLPRLIYRPAILFALGALITLVSMSVSISLSILVPLSVRGYIRRENIVPYVMGANISTFIDTLLAAVLLSNPLGITVVLAQIVSIALVSLAILFLCYHRYERAMLAVLSLITRRNCNLALFTVTLLVMPVGLILV